MCASPPLPPEDRATRSNHRRHEPIVEIFALADEIANFVPSYPRLLQLISETEHAQALRAKISLRLSQKGRSKPASWAIQLLLAPQSYKPRRRTRCRLGVALGTLSSFFCALRGASVLRRHKPNLMTSHGKQPMMCATASLHRNNAHWQLLNEFDQRVSPHRPTENHSTAIIHPHNAAAILADVDTQCGNLHGTFPFKRKPSYSMSSEGRAGQ
jgi:hypothetical protein